MLRFGWLYRCRAGAPIPLHGVAPVKYRCLLLLELKGKSGISLRSRPFGICRDGNLWVALPEGSALGCYDPATGELKQKVRQRHFSKQRTSGGDWKIRAFSPE